MDVLLNAMHLRFQHTEFTDTSVLEFHQYEYRVTAINAAGHGSPSDPSLTMTAKPMKGECADHDSQTHER